MLKGYIHFFTEGAVDTVGVDDALIGCRVQLEDVTFDASGAEAAPACSAPIVEACVEGLAASTFNPRL